MQPDRSDCSKSLARLMVARLRLANGDIGWRCRPSALFCKHAQRSGTIIESPVSLCKRRESSFENGGTLGPAGPCFMIGHRSIAKPSQTTAMTANSVRVGFQRIRWLLEIHNDRVQAVRGVKFNGKHYVTENSVATLCSSGFPLKVTLRGCDCRIQINHQNLVSSCFPVVQDIIDQQNLWLIQQFKV